MCIDKRRCEKKKKNVRSNRADSISADSSLAWGVCVCLLGVTEVLTGLLDTQTGRKVNMLFFQMLECCLQCLRDLVTVNEFHFDNVPAFAGRSSAYLCFTSNAYFKGG